MKRSGPPARRTPLGRGKPLARGTKRLPPVSEKRRRQLPARADVRAEVLRRAGHRCEAPALVPEVRCGSPFPDRPALEVDELTGGANRSIEWLDPDRCQALCQLHHDWKTEHKAEYLRRRAASRNTGCDSE